jgi:hypothetical protein
MKNFETMKLAYVKALVSYEESEHFVQFIR